MEKNSILTELRKGIERGQIQVKISSKKDNYKTTELTDLLTGEKLIPEYIVPQTKEINNKNCELCKKVINLNQVYTTRQQKGSEIITYFHSKCQLLEGTTSSDKNWDGTIKNDDK